METLNTVFDEIIKKSDEINPKTVAALANRIGLSAAQLSRIRSGKSSLSDNVVTQLYELFANADPAYANDLKTRLEKVRDSVDEALESFDRFFQTSENESRILCFLYRDFPQSAPKGRYPEYMLKSAREIKRGLKCAVFQPYGPLETIRKRVNEALIENDREALGAWSYIYRMASEIHDDFTRTHQAVNEGGDSNGQIVLYEAADTPALHECSVGYRSAYSEKRSGTPRIRIVQLMIGADKHYFIEYSSDPVFQTTVAAQFEPVLKYWRNEEKLPETEAHLKKYHQSEAPCFWTIPKIKP